MVLASEELRGPLTSVTGYLQVLLDGEAGPLEAGQQRMVEIAARNAERMERLLDTLIVVAQVRAGRGAHDRIDLARLVRERTKAAVPMAESRGLRLGLGEDLMRQVMGDEASLTHALDYLIEHALSFCTPGGTVEVIARDVGETVIIEVQDDGIPLQPHEARELFAGRSPALIACPRALLGARLGLFMVRMVAEAHGGGAEAESGDDECTRLRLILPAAAPGVGRLAA